MLEHSAVPLSADAVDAAKDYLRLDGGADDGVIASLIVSAMAQAEAFARSVLIERDFAETLAGSGAWSSLAAWPVVSVTGVSGTGGVPLAVGSYEADIGVDGTGRVRLTGTPPQRVRVTYRAGRVTGWTAIAEPVRQGIVRLVAHHFEARDRGDDGGLPDAVAALWRGARRLVLS